MPIQWKQAVDIIDAGGDWLDGPEIALPIPPFPGLAVGALIVQGVSVCQGGDGGSCEIQYQPIDKGHARILHSHGWRYHESEE